jgi:hypothetical protein
VWRKDDVEAWIKEKCPQDCARLPGVMQQYFKRL